MRWMISKEAQMAYSALQVEGVIDNNGNLNQGVDIEKLSSLI